MAERDVTKDSGDASQASAAIEAFLRSRGEPLERDSAALLDLRLALARVCEADLVKRDAAASSALNDMAMAESMDDLGLDIDRLALRVSELTAADRPAAIAAAPSRPARRMLRL